MILRTCFTFLVSDLRELNLRDLCADTQQLCLITKKANKAREPRQFRDRQQKTRKKKKFNKCHQVVGGLFLAGHFFICLKMTD